MSDCNWPKFVAILHSENNKLRYERECECAMDRLYQFSQFAAAADNAPHWSQHTQFTRHMDNWQRDNLNCIHYICIYAVAWQAANNNYTCTRTQLLFDVCFVHARMGFTSVGIYIIYAYNIYNSIYTFMFKYLSQLSWYKTTKIIIVECGLCKWWSQHNSECAVFKGGRLYKNIHTYVLLYTYIYYINYI